MQAPKWPTPGHDQCVGAQRAFRVAGDLRRRRRRAAARARPTGGCPSRSRRSRSSQGALRAGDHAATPGEAARVAERLRHALERRLEHVVGRAPRLQSDVDRELGRLRERAHEVLDEPGVERADHLGRDVDLVHDERAAGQVERDLDRGLVERHGDRGEPAHAGLVAERLLQRLPQREAHVLGRVVAVDLEVAGARAPRGPTRRACRAGSACGRRTAARCRSSCSRRRRGSATP